MKNRKLLDSALEFMLKPSDFTLERMEKEFHILEEQIAAFQKIDVTNVKPMWTPIQIQQSFLREDVVESTLPVAKVLQNVSESKEQFIVVKKVQD